MWSNTSPGDGATSDDGGARGIFDAMRKVMAPARERLGAIGADARAIGHVVGTAMRRPATYPGFAKELLLTGMNMALYPAGLLSDAIKDEAQTTFGDRWSREIPFHYLEPEAASTPIVLVHGALHNRSAFLLMKRSLRKRGFRFVYTINYSIFGHDVPEIAQRLAAHVDHVIARSQATQVHLVGHSLGGLIARYYVQMLGGHEKVHTCITMGTPHQGTHAAVMGRATRSLKPGSPLIRTLAENARPCRTRFVSFYSNLDSLILPASNAKIAESDLRPANILVKDQGHLSLLVSRQLMHAVGEILSSLDTGASANVYDHTAEPPAASDSA